jgi:hypothetical protein
MTAVVQRESKNLWHVDAEKPNQIYAHKYLTKISHITYPTLSYRTLYNVT